MGFPIADRTFTAVFAGAEKYDFIFLGSERDRFETGPGMAVVTERLAFAQTTTAPEIGEAFEHPGREWLIARYSGQRAGFGLRHGT